MINTTDEEHVPVPGVDVPNYGAEALAAQAEGAPLPKPAQEASVNDIQHGGDHYKRHVYQHWDFVCDMRMPYLLGCATKYVARWRQKNGVEDLRKALHYIDKAEERGVVQPPYNPERLVAFIVQLDVPEDAIVVAIANGAYDGARTFIKALIKQEEANASA